MNHFVEPIHNQNNLINLFEGGYELHKHIFCKPIYNFGSCHNNLVYFLKNYSTLLTCQTNFATFFGFILQVGSIIIPFQMCYGVFCIIM